MSLILSKVEKYKLLILKLWNNMVGEMQYKNPNKN